MITDLDQTKVSFHPLTARTREGDDLTLSCKASGNPEPTISWTRNGFSVDTRNNSRIRLTVLSDTNIQLNITNVSRTDSGEYRCVASNIIGNDSSNVVKLDIQCKNTALGLLFIS